MDALGILVKGIELDDLLPKAAVDFINKARVSIFGEPKLEQGISIRTPIIIKQPSILIMNHYNYIEENMLGLGYGYYLFSDFPRRMLPIVKILQESRIYSGIDIDQSGHIRHSKEK